MSRQDGIKHCNRKYWVPELSIYLNCHNVVDKCGDNCEVCKPILGKIRKPRKDKDSARYGYHVDNLFPWKFNSISPVDIYLDITL